jgi:hypothetical protein
MKMYGSLIAASVVSVITAGALAARVTFQTRHFDKTVQEALKTSEGYDEKFIEMVNRLERELALRASFGYIGGKDPMTGKERIVVFRQPLRKRIGQPATVNGPRVEQTVDSVKLTAVIYDDAKKSYTAIIMVGERSFAIETGDLVVGRKVSRIDNGSVVMEDNAQWYIYDIAGNLDIRMK